MCTMLCYVNIALSIFLVGFILSQLKAERRITQKHFDGDWRQKLYFYNYINVDDMNVVYLAWCTYLALSVLSIVLYGDIPILLVLGLSPPFIGLIPLILMYIVLIDLILLILNIMRIKDVFYYNPLGKYCLVKSKSSGKYIIFQIKKHNLPNPDYILQHLGDYNNSHFNSEQDVLNEISKLNNINYQYR